MGLIIEGRTSQGTPSLTIGLTYEDIAHLMSGDAIQVRPETHQTVAADVTIGIVAAPSDEALADLVQRAALQEMANRRAAPVILADAPKGAQ